MKSQQSPPETGETGVPQPLSSLLDGFGLGTHPDHELPELDPEPPPTDDEQDEADEDEARKTARRDDGPWPLLAQCLNPKQARIHWAGTPGLWSHKEDAKQRAAYHRHRFHERARVEALAPTHSAPVQELPMLDTSGEVAEHVAGMFSQTPKHVRRACYGHPTASLVADLLYERIDVAHFRLTREITSAHWTQEAMAREIGCHPVTIWRAIRYLKQIGVITHTENRAGFTPPKGRRRGMKFNLPNRYKLAIYVNSAWPTALGSDLAPRKMLEGMKSGKRHQKVLRSAVVMRALRRTQREKRHEVLKQIQMEKGPLGLTPAFYRQAFEPTRNAVSVEGAARQAITYALHVRRAEEARYAAASEAQRQRIPIPRPISDNERKAALDAAYAAFGTSASTLDWPEGYRIAPPGALRPVEAPG